MDADGFEADKVPTTYELASGVTAHFDGIKYSGSSTTAANTGFTEVPSSYASASSCFLTSTSIANGTLYYYFTSNATAPSKTTFDSFHEASAVKGSYTVAKTTMDKNVATTMASAAYPYIIVMLRDNNGNSYDPLVISNRASSGFSVAPEVSTSNSYHYLAYTPTVGGTLYYYYTNNSDVPTVSSFSSTYTANSTSYKGTVDVSAGKSASSVLLSTSRVSNYAYIAVMLEEKIGENYQPVLVPAKATVSSLGNGFSSTPKCTLTADGIALSYNAANTGTLQYYFTSTNVEPSAAQFDTNLALADTAMTGAATVTAGKSATLTIGKNVSASSYPYVVLRLTSGTTRYNPVVVSTSGVALDLTGTGFNAVPTVSVENGYYTLKLNTSYASKVYYYVTSNPIAVSSDIFLKNYQTFTSSLSTSPSGGYVTTYGYSASTLRTDLRASAQNSNSYLTLMVNIGTQNFKPIVIPMPVVTAEEMNSGNMFLVGPSYMRYSGSMHQIEFTAKVPGRVYVYYTSEPESLKAYEIITMINWGRLGDGIGDYKTVQANVEERIAFSRSDGDYPEYAAVIFVDESNNIFEPIVLATDGSSAPVDGIGFINIEVVRTSAHENPVANYKTNQAGKAYYYFTSSSTKPTNATAFLNAYNSSSLAYLRGEFSVGFGSGSSELTSQISAANYPYVVLLFQSATGGTGGYASPVLLRVNNSGSGSSSSMFSTNAFYSQPSLNGSYLYYSPVASGTLYYSFANSDDVMEWLAPAVKLQSISGSSSLGSITPTRLSQYICHEGEGSYIDNVSAYGNSTKTANISLKNYKYLVVWMVTLNDVMTAPEFISIGGSNNITGIPTTTNNGFYTNPAVYGGYVYFTSNVNGYVEYFYSSSSAPITSAQFETQFDDLRNINESLAGVNFFEPGVTQSFQVAAGMKYVWLRVVDVSNVSNRIDYAPVCVMIP